MTTTTWRSTSIRSGLAGVVVGAGVFGMLTLGGIVVPLQPAAAADGSSVTVTAAAQHPDAVDAPFPDLAVTVSQTRDLVAQGIKVSWTGGRRSTVPSQQTGGEDFLQIAQCWGDDPADATRPDRTTCQFGGANLPGSTRDGYREDAAVAAQDEQYTVHGDGFATPTYTSVPFRPIVGDPVRSIVDGVQVGVDVNTNPYFTRLTTNEVSWAGSGSDGTGSTAFEVQTAMQAPGLGCGTPVGTGNDVRGQSCWLVIIPRGTADNGSTSITQSGLFWDSWRHALAVKLEFKPLGTRCAIGAAERQLAGSELAATAIASWQPTLCTAAGGAVYSLITGSESDAALAANGMSGAPLALTSRALGGDAEDGLSYAPIALTSVTVAFAIDREPKASSDVPAEAADRARLPMTSLKLTPRLLAKLLTNSYADSLPTGADRSHLRHNPRTLSYDPDFLAVNDPEWAYQALVAPSLADLLMPQGRSDAAWALWSYIVADPDAAAFLAGHADPWGMVVNPYYATTAAANATGVELSLPRDDFPKADPAEQPEASGVGPVNVVTWRPYVTDFDTVGYLTLRGDGQLLGAWDPVSQPPKYGKAARALPGQQRVLGLTDAAAAAKYQVYTAELRNPAGVFVAPTGDAMAAAAAAMTPDAKQPQVRGFVPSSSAAKGATTAYPLTMPVYAATNPSVVEAALRSDYAAFIRFAAGAGQTPGTSDGQLPAGYAPLPSSWRAQALAAADAIAAGPRTPATTPAASGGSWSSTPDVVDVNPTAGGEIAGALMGDATPADPEVGGLPATIPVSVLSGLAAAVGVPLLGRRRVLPWSPR